MDAITITICNTPNGRLLARSLEIMDGSGCTMGEAMDRAKYEQDHNLIGEVADVAGPARRGGSALMKRRLTVELTEAEFNALASASALAEAEWGAAYDDDPAWANRSLKALDRAWNKLNEAWHARAR